MAKGYSVLRERLLADPDGRRAVEEEQRALDAALALAEAREARGVTQAELARRLATAQPNVSRTEHADDFYLSTLREYVEALGGRLAVYAEFPEGVVRLRLPGDPVTAGR